MAEGIEMENLDPETSVVVDDKYRLETREEKIKRKMEELRQKKKKKFFLEEEEEEMDSDTKVTSTSFEISRDSLKEIRDFFKEKEYEEKIKSRKILLMDTTTQTMGIEAKKILLSSYPDAGGIRYEGIELGVIRDEKKEDIIKLV